MTARARRHVIPPTVIENTATVVDIFEKGADPSVDKPYAAAYKVTSHVHSTGRRFIAVSDGSHLSRHDEEVDLYPSGGL